ncbi:hypothetical protein KFU94_21325 [Chloroflexi bacterium TSY]|nr:hypothetical protein [Chloroflexi bacterium TSY]
MSQKCAREFAQGGSNHFAHFWEISENNMLLTSHLNHPDILDILSEAETLRRWVLIEVALAEVQGSLGIIDQQSVAQISRSALHFQPNVTALEVAMEQTGVPIAELVKQLRKHVGPPAADLVHHGATTQDIMDTAFVMQIRDALDVVIEPLLDQVISRLATLADEHRATLMAGRTHSQQALPITFGVKVANWLAPLLRHRERLTELRPRLLVIQFGAQQERWPHWERMACAFSVN